MQKIQKMLRLPILPRMQKNRRLPRLLGLPGIQKCAIIAKNEENAKNPKKARNS